MSKYTALDFAKKVLKTQEKPLTFQEIWEIGKEQELDKIWGTKGKTPWNTIGAKLFVEVRDNKEKTLFAKIGKNPARFILKEKLGNISDEELLKDVEKESVLRIETKVKTFKERDLHPLLTYFAYSNAGFNHGKAILTKTIYHEKSKKSGLSEWTHPDVVGFYIPLDDWNEEVIELNKISDNNSIRLFSFELKKTIGRGNYREYFFQAVSNSSWAHEGYLVAAEIQEDEDLMTELDRLSSSFGIGIIRLDVKDIDASQVIFPAKTKEFLDWETISKLCDSNPDFSSFIDNIRKDFEVKTIHRSEYDKILPDPEDYISKNILKETK